MVTASGQSIYIHALLYSIIVKTSRALQHTYPYLFHLPILWMSLVRRFTSLNCSYYSKATQYVNGMARTLLLASGTEFDATKREIEDRNIFYYACGNVEEQEDCLYMVVTSLAPSLNQFSDPNRFCFLCSDCSFSGKGQVKREFYKNHCIMEVRGGTKPKNSFSKSITIHPPFGGLPFDHDKPASLAQSLVVPNELEEESIPSPALGAWPVEKMSWEFKVSMSCYKNLCLFKNGETQARRGNI